MDNLIKEYIVKPGPDSNFSKKEEVENFVDIYMLDPKVKGFGIEGFVSVLIDSWFYISKIIPTRLINIIFDLSAEPSLYFVLIQEQKDLIKKYGYCITHDILKKMVFMDAFIKESLTNSSSASYIFRCISHDMFLSNGTFLRKGQLISINMFSKAHTTALKTGKRFDIRKHIFNKKSFTEPSMDNLIWGHGVRECPFSEYSGTLIKIFIALLIRKLYVFSNIDGNPPVHPGYINIRTVVPLEHSVYFKRHNINDYRDLIDLEEEYNSIMNSNSNSNL
ncbi:hypothetical protein BB560_003540 [Smittium megazygosporum]|uniref:Cytochrome P450 n=1 Tax=Smittium megazygosporum TaxID=133381 RepID=A0A2T9ZBN9_9FUNG|nr:hypothetical protein BB560_003540 [Smittium megazygosporum]